VRVIIASLKTFRRWTVEVSQETASFRCAPTVEDHTAVRALPRIWAGRGLGLPEYELAGFAAALAEVMKTHAYWAARARRDGRGIAEHWTVPRRDDDDGFVYVTGPADRRNSDAGYRPASVFTLELADVRGLRIRLAAYLGKQCA
jgi:hypothetical protein